MEMKKQPLATPTVCKIKNRIEPKPDYQRPRAWSHKQKQSLVDTILRNYDIPKFHSRKVNRVNGVQYEVVDGQQRLRAGREFEADEFPIGKLIPARQLQEVSDALMDLEGSAGLLTPGDVLRLRDVHNGWFWAAPLIASGADEIMHSIVGERVLRLSPEPRFDKNVPFRDLGGRR